MNPFRKIIQASCSVLPAGLLAKLSGVRLLLPYHHVVSDESLPHIKELYSYKNKQKFIKDLDWLLKRFEPIHPESLGQIAFHNKSLDKNHFLLSFDDGFREVYDVIAPILSAKGVPALFFINSAFIDNKELFYRCKLSLILNKAKSNSQLAENIANAIECNFSGYLELRKAVLQIAYPNRFKADELGRIAEIDFDDFLQKQQPYLTTEQIKTLHTKGFAFGGHSIDHPHYKFINKAEQCNQTITSTAFVKQLLQSRHDYFAFPHEDHQVQQEFFKKMNELKTEFLFFGTQNQRLEEHNRVFHRFNAERPDENIGQVVNTILSYNFFLEFFNKRKIVRK